MDTCVFSLCGGAWRDVAVMVVVAAAAVEKVMALMGAVFFFYGCHGPAA